MMLDDQTRRIIAGRAQTLHERLDGVPNEPGADSPFERDELLNTWRELFPDEETFHERLADEGLDVSTVHEQLTATEWPADEPLPEWLDTIEELIRYLRQHPPQRCHGTPEDTPFVDLLEGFAEFAVARLGSVPFTDEAIAPLVEGLIRRLHALCVRPLFVEFKSFVEHHEPELAQADPDHVDGRPTEYYEQFIDAMYRHGFENLCVEYPVLARQLATVLDQWVGAISEFGARLDADRDALREQFGATGTVTELEPLSTDAHARGRIPIRVRFESTDVIYKPRDVAGGEVLYETLTRLSTHLSFPDFRSPTYLTRDGYGWMESIEYDNLADTAAIDEYYRQAGALACVAYALNLTDCQYENLIVDGESPMIVDGETLFHPYVAPEGTPSPTEVASVSYSSILSTLLVPWSIGDPRNPHDEEVGVPHAGFGSSSEQAFKDASKPYVEGANTDVMVVKEIQPEVSLNTNTASTEDRDHPPVENLEPMLEGFAETYETIIDLRDAGRFFEEVVPEDRLDSVENRLVYRATARYGSVLRAAAGRDPLRDGARLSLEFESLVVPFFDGRIDEKRYRTIYEAERRALRRRDFPRFSATPTTREVHHDDEPLGLEVDQSGYERSRQRVDQMDSDDLARQQWLLEYTFGPDVSGPAPSPVSQDKSLTDTATTLFDEALDAAVTTTDERRWVSITPTETGIDIYPTDFSLYHGRGGIALSAAALYAVTEREQYREIADQILDPVVESIEEGGLPPHLGGMLGVGSVVYSLTVISDLLQNETYQETARTAADVVSDDHISQDRTFDVLEGAAGTLLGLLAYYDRHGGTEVLELARACGERLLDGRTKEQGHLVWTSATEDVPLSGFSHGASGIGYALARLSEVTDDSRYSSAAREALSFEEMLYDPERHNWAKSPTDHSFVDKWCHGRSGMALARLGIADALGDDELRVDATTVLGETANAPSSSMDHLCCGNLGRAEALLVGSRRGEIDRSHAIDLARQCIARRDQEGELSMTGHTRTFPNPMLFHGLSGAAYSLLRLEHPDVLPSVLLLE